MGGGGSKSIPISKMIDKKTEVIILNEYNLYDKDVQQFRNIGFRGKKTRRSNTNSREGLLKSLVASLLLLFIVFLLGIMLYR